MEEVVEEDEEYSTIKVENDSMREEEHEQKYDEGESLTAEAEAEMIEEKCEKDEALQVEQNENNLNYNVVQNPINVFKCVRFEDNLSQ